MALFLKLTPQLQVSPMLQCTCCNQMFSEQQRDETHVNVALFGTANAYVICPVCLQEVPPTIRQDAEYQRKARVEMYLRYQIVLRQTWTPDYSEPAYEMQDEPRRRKKVDDD